jgi:phosphatidylserine decarboxylase
MYKCPDSTNRNIFGFPCWNDFFVRDFTDGQRPIDSPDDDSVIVHACKSVPLQYPVKNVELSDNFQGKNQKYSLIDMMDQDPLARGFVGGTVY